VHIEESRRAQAGAALRTHEAVLVERLALEVDVLAAEWPAALFACGAGPIRATHALAVSIFCDEFSSQFLSALDALEATSVPSLAQGSKDSIFDRSMAMRAVLPFHTFIVVRATLQDHVLASDSAVALGARHELACTGRAVHLRVVVVVRSDQFLVAFSASEMLLVVVLASSSDELSAIEAAIALRTVSVGDLLRPRRLDDGGLPLVLFNVSLFRRSGMVGVMGGHRKGLDGCVVVDGLVWGLVVVVRGGGRGRGREIDVD
jgi:hypothetical protein